LWSDEWDQEFYRVHYKTKKYLLKPLIKTLKPTDTKKNFNAKNWQGVENISRLMIHAKTICEALCYIETLRVFKDHCHIDKSRFDLFKRYKVLVAPRLAGLYKDWELREYFFSERFPLQLPRGHIAQENCILCALIRF